MKLLTAVAALAVVYGCAEARAVDRLRVEFWQDADSARYAISWVAGPQSNRQRATAYYEVEMLSAGVLVAGDTTSALTDTLAVAYPPLDSIMPLLVRVRAVDTDGDSSDWAESSPFTLTATKLPPSPPAGVSVDTTAMALVGVFLRPTIVTTLADGGTIQFCSFYLLANGDTGLTINSQGIARCDELYSRWLTERSV